MTALNDAGRTLEVRGASVPRLGLGTWQITGAPCREALRDALQAGYRHIDTARAYGNEREIGAVLAENQVDRADVFLTTKVWPDELEPSRLRASAEASLRDLATDYVDLLLIHWPNPAVALERSLEAMVELRERGLIRHLGVANFPPAMLERALGIAPVMCNQVEFHPFLGQDELLGVAAEHGVMVTAYAPLAHGRVLSDPTLAAIAGEHGTGPAQIALSWLLGHPLVSAIPKAASHANRVSNLEVWGIELTEAQRAQIDRLPKDQRGFNPSWAPDWAA